MAVISEILSKTSAKDSQTAQSAKTARHLLRLVRAAQPVSRIELARRLEINRSTVTDIFQPLIAADFLREMALPSSPKASRAQGRPPVGIAFNDAEHFFVGINIGVRGTQIGLATLSDEVLAETDFQIPSEPVAALRLIRESTERLCGRVRNRRLQTIGVSVPGPTDSARRKLLYAPHLGWRDVAIADALETVGGKPPVTVIVENDATAAAVYEAKLQLKNAGEGLPKDFVLLRSGTGIGVGMMIDGEIYRGAENKSGLAGEFGHTTIVAGGKPCICGNRGCWEMYASASAASSLYEGDRAQITRHSRLRFVEIVERAEAGEMRAQRTLERVGEYLGIGIGNLITGLGVPRVILSGRIAYGWKFFKQPLRKAVAKSMAGKLADWSVDPGEPRGAGLSGAIEVAVDEYLMRGLKV